MKIQAEAPGKLILIGEYAVLEGAPAIVTAVDRYARVVVDESRDGDFEVDAPALELENVRFRADQNGHLHFQDPFPEKLAFFRSIFTSALEIILKEKSVLRPARILLDTDAFFSRKAGAKLGLGSSAALTVALLAALFSWSDIATFKEETDRWRLFNLALDAHRKAQGSVGSGIDIAACVFGGTLIYQLKGPAGTAEAEIRPVRFPENLFCLPVWSGKPSSTSQLVRRFFEYKEKNGNGYRAFLKHLSGLSVQARDAFLAGDRHTFLDCVKNYYRKMVEVGRTIGSEIISPEHRRIADCVYRHGAVYKPSGAGGGDLGIAFTTVPEPADLVAELHNAGYEVLPLSFGAEGIRVKRTDR